MNARRNFGSTSPIMMATAAALAAIITAGILWALVSLFQIRGAPMERLAADEPACVMHRSIRA